MLGHRKRILASLGDRRRSRHSSTIDIEISRPHSLDIDITSSEDLVRPPKLKTPSSCENLLSSRDTAPALPPRPKIGVKPSTGRDSVKARAQNLRKELMSPVSSKTSQGAVAPRLSTDRGGSSKNKAKTVVPKAVTPGQAREMNFTDQIWKLYIYSREN